MGAKVVKGGAREMSIVEGFKVCLGCVSEFGLGWVVRMATDCCYIRWGESRVWGTALCHAEE